MTKMGIRIIKAKMPFYELSLMIKWVTTYVQ